MSRKRVGQQENKQETNADRIYALINLMKEVDIDGPEAQLNEISISDGEGGRIYF